MSIVMAGLGNNVKKRKKNQKKRKKKERNGEGEGGGLGKIIIWEMIIPKSDIWMIHLT